MNKICSIISLPPICQNKGAKKQKLSNFRSTLSRICTEHDMAKRGSIPTFHNPAIFAEVLLQGLFGGLRIQSADEELPWSVGLRHAPKSAT